MFDMIMRVFSNPDKETIKIFEDTLKIKYEEEIFTSLKALSISYTKLENLEPFRVFSNLEILNLPYNKIRDIEPLEELKKLKVIDLRFNKISKLPKWIFLTDKNIYWERSNNFQQGIFLEGNPLGRKLIEKIKKNQNKNYSTKKKNIKKLKEPIKKVIESFPKNIEKPKQIFSMPKVEKLIPLNRQKVTIIKPKGYKSEFLKLFVKPNKAYNQLKLNISIAEYKEIDYEKFIFNPEISKDIKYTILLLNGAKCCLYPAILKEIAHYSKSKIFLIIETKDSGNIEKKVTFLKEHNRFRNIIDVYYTSNSNESRDIKENIYSYLDNTSEVNSLWKKEWIGLRDSVEQNKNLTKNDFLSLALDRYRISKSLGEYLYSYLSKVGSIDGGD